MRWTRGKLADHVGDHVVSSPEGTVLVTSPGTKSSYPHPPQSLAASRNTSPQSAGQLGTRTNQRRGTLSIQHHLQELISRSTATAPLTHGHRTNTALDLRLRTVTTQTPRTTLHRRLPCNPTEVLHAGIPGPSRHILCSQASFRGVLF